MREIHPLDSGPQDGLPALVDLTYSATVDPGRYQELLSVWERFMSRLSPGEIEDAQTHHLKHFNQALDIFERIGRQKERRDRDTSVVALFDTPAFILSRSGQIKQSNLPASDGHDPALLTRAASPLDSADLESALAQVQSGADVALVPVHDAHDRLIDCAVISAISVQEGEEDRYLAVFSGPKANEEQLGRLKDHFKFSDAELDVFTALLAGEKVADISARRGVGEATTRTQVRHLLDKTGSASLADMIRQSTQIIA